MTSVICRVQGREKTRQTPDHELWIGLLRDPDGNLVGLLEEQEVDSFRSPATVPAIAIAARLPWVP
jgi:hypothetical protein